MPTSVLSRGRIGDDLVYDRSFDELRTGFTAAGSHELRTPLARILALLDSADLPGADVQALIDQARAEVENAGVLIDEILFLSELESGKEIVSLGHTAALPVLQEVARDLEDASARAGVAVVVTGDDTVEVPLRPRMLKVILSFCFVTTISQWLAAVEINEPPPTLYVCQMASTKGESEGRESKIKPIVN